MHAEQNAIADAARRGSSLDGCIAYVTHYPCINCAKILAAAGIRTIKYHSDYHNDPLVPLVIGDAGVDLVKLADFALAPRAKPRLFHSPSLR